MTAKKSRDLRELFDNLKGSDILDEVPIKESILCTMTKPARIMAMFMNIRCLQDAILSNAIAASALIRKLPGAPRCALQIGGILPWCQHWGPKLRPLIEQGELPSPLSDLLARKAGYVPG